MDNSESDCSLSSGSQSVEHLHTVSDSACSTTSYDEDQEARTDSPPVITDDGREASQVVFSQIIAGKVPPGATVVVMDSDGNLLIDICVDQSPTDDRKTFFFRVRLANQGAIPALEPDGPWVRKRFFTYCVDPQEFIRLIVNVEALDSVWCPTKATQARFTENSWQEMKIDSNTHRTITISAAQLANGDVVTSEWCGTCSTAFSETRIPGALELMDVMEDGISDGGRELFELCTLRSYPSGQPRIIVFPTGERTVANK